MEHCSGKTNAEANIAPSPPVDVVDGQPALMKVVRLETLDPLPVTEKEKRDA